MRWLKAGIEMFSLKGEGTVIPGEENLATVQRAGELSLNHPAASEEDLLAWQIFPPF